jgi:glutamate-1-semialdehyde 2,1-aminomutase
MANVPVLGVIQARLGSSRLPGKVLKGVRVSFGNGDEPSTDELPMLGVMWHRVRTASTVARWALATTLNRVDDGLADWAAAHDVPCFRGSENDVLDRFYQTALLAGCGDDTLMVRLTADCPLNDGANVDHVVGALIEARQEAAKAGKPLPDYAYNCFDARTAPDGLDVEAFTFSALRRAAKEADAEPDREHVTPHVRRHSPTPLIEVAFKHKMGDARWTVDTAEDLEFVRNVTRLLTDKHAGAAKNAVEAITSFTTLDVADLLLASPDLQTINSARGAGAVGPGAVACPEGQALYTRAKKVIPGGTQLLSKRPEMFLPDQWPSYYRRATGCQVSDIDGHRFVDASYNGIGACILGAGDPDVDEAVHVAVEHGSMSTLNVPDEVILAEKLISLHSEWAGGVRYARSGGESMALAVRVARAHTKRDVIAVCGYHGWHDWYLAANLGKNDQLAGHLLPGLAPAGVPQHLRGSMVTFAGDDIAGLEALVKEHGQSLAAIVMEPLRSSPPIDGFLATARRLATESGAVLVFDEITAGFRLNVGGSHKILKSTEQCGAGGYVEPDIAVFAKGMSNGFAFGAIVGRGEVMDSAQSSFISSTYFTEAVGFAAARATIEKFERLEVYKHIERVGKLVCDAWESRAREADLPLEVERGNYALPHFGWLWPGTEAAPPGIVGRAMKTLFTQMMLDRGYLATPSFYITYAHTPEVVEEYSKVLGEVFPVISQLLKAAKAAPDDTAAVAVFEKELRGPICHAGFARLNK